MQNLREDGIGMNTPRKGRWMNVRSARNSVGTGCLCAGCVLSVAVKQNDKNK
jgi:hypothetical protein